MKTTMIVILMSVLASVVNAQEGQSRGILSSGGLSGKWGTIAPFVGLGAGYTGYSKNLDIEGIPANAKIIGSYVSPSQLNVFDLGYGFQNQRFSQTNALDRNVQSPILEAAYRYHLENGLQAGVVWNTVFNGGSAYGANQADAQFAGVQALKEFQVGDNWVMRAGGRYMTDVNVIGTWVNIAMIDVQFGWNPNQSRSVQSARASNMNAERNQDAQRTAAIDSSTTPTNTKMSRTPRTADSYSARKDLLLFGLDSAALNSRDQRILEKLAANLKDNEGVVEQVEVVGYADPTGTEQHNLQLSKQRAESVKNALEKNGMKDSKIRVVARGEKEPIGNDFEKSRRVELRFNDVKDQDKLKEIVSQVE